MNTNPHGKARCSIGPSSKYRSHVKYQHTARFSSSKNRCEWTTPFELNNWCNEFVMNLPKVYLPSLWSHHWTVVPADRQCSLAPTFDIFAVTAPIRLAYSWLSFVEIQWFVVSFCQPEATMNRLAFRHRNSSHCNRFPPNCHSHQDWLFSLVALLNEAKTSYEKVDKNYFGFKTNWEQGESLPFVLVSLAPFFVSSWLHSFIELSQCLEQSSVSALQLSWPCAGSSAFCRSSEGKKCLFGSLAKDLGPDALIDVRYAVASFHSSTSVDIVDSPNESVESFDSNTLHRIISQ